MQTTDIELFADNLDDTFQTGRENNVIRRRSQRVHTNLPSQSEENRASRWNADQDRKNFSDAERTEVYATAQTLQIDISNLESTQHEESRIIDIISDSETDFTNTQDQQRENSSNIQGTTVTYPRIQMP